MESETTPLNQEYNSLMEKMAMATIMSQSLLYVSGRNYLEFPEKDCSQLFRISQKRPPQLPPHFIHIAQLGKPLLGDPYEPLLALQTALAACHDDYNQQLIFLVIHDGHYNNIYMGVRHNQHPPNAFMRSFQHFFRGLYCGSQLEYLTPNKDSYKTKIIEPLKEMEYGICLTGIPSIKQSGNVEYLSCLDRLLKGIQGEPFAYIVIADPISPTDVDNITYRCRDLIGQVHALSKMNITKGFSHAVTNQVSVTKTEGKQTGETKTDASTKLGALSILGGLIGGGSTAVTALGALMAFPPAALVVGIAGVYAASRLPLFKNSSFSTNTTISESLARTISQSVSDTESMQMSVEFINAHVQAAEKLLSQYEERFYSKRALGHWNVGVYCLSAVPQTVELAGTQLQAVLNGSASMLEPLRWHKLESFMGEVSVRNALQRLEVPQLVFKSDSQHPFGELFNNLTTPLTTPELSLLINYPRREIPGIKLIPTAEFSLNRNAPTEKSIFLGNLIDTGTETKLPYTLDIASLAKHCLITGITGSGKSTTCRKLLTELNQQQIPFLVIEPAKDEYVEWAMNLNAQLPKNSPNRIAIYMPGIQTWRGQKLENQLTLNPFDLVWLSEDSTPQVLPHIDRLKSILNASFPMQEILPVLLEDVLFYAYTHPQNWLDDKLPAFGTPRPTLTQLLDQIQPVIKGKGYEERVTANLTAALTTRIQSLRRGWKGKLFDRPISTPWAEIFDRPAIINLSYLGDDADKAFAMAILLQFLYEYRQIQNDLLSQKERENLGLRHLAVIEEAHRLLLKVSSGISEQANPQGKVAEMFANILSEIRAYGQGLLIADQVPARLVPDAIKNTNLKIVHRLVAADDRDAMGSCMTLTPEQSAIINHLRSGQAIICGEQDDMAAWVQVLKQDSTKT